MRYLIILMLLFPLLVTAQEKDLKDMTKSERIKYGTERRKKAIQEKINELEKELARFRAIFGSMDSE